MALAHTIDSLDKVAEPLREHYVAQGKVWRLDVPDHDAHIERLNSESKGRRLRIAELETKLAAGGDAERLKTLEGELLGERRAMADVLVGQALVRGKVLGDHLGLLSEKLAPRVAITVENGKRSIVVLAEDGKTPLAGGLQALVSEASARWPGAFTGISPGSGARQSRGPTAPSSTIKRAAFDQMSPTQKSIAVSSGKQLID